MSGDISQEDTSANTSNPKLDWGKLILNWILLVFSVRLMTNRNTFYFFVGLILFSWLAYKFFIWFYNKSEKQTITSQTGTSVNISNPISDWGKRIPNWILLLVTIILITTGAATGFLFFVIIGTAIDLLVLYRIFAKAVKKTRTPMVYNLASIDGMDGYQFERCMADIYKRLGYSVHHTPLSGDQGADLIITSKEGVRSAVQCKCYSNKVSNKAVQEVVASKAIHRCTSGIVVTNNYYTDSAKQLARANGIVLVDRTGLQKMISEISRAKPYHNSEIYT